MAVEAAAVREHGVGQQLDVARPLRRRCGFEQRGAELDLARPLLGHAEPVQHFRERGGVAAVFQQVARLLEPADGFLVRELRQRAFAGGTGRTRWP